MRRIQGKKHKMGTYKINKISLPCIDDKRFVQMMVFIGLLIFIKTQILTNKKEFSRKRRDSHG